MKKEYKFISGWVDSETNSDDKYPNKELNELAKQGFVVESYKSHGDSSFVSFLLSREIKD